MEKRAVNNKTNKRKKTMKYWRLFRGVSITLIVTTIIFMLSLFRIDLLSGKYMLLLVTGIVVVEWVLLFVLNKRFKPVIKVPFMVVAVLLSGIFCFGTYNVAFAQSLVSRIVGSVIAEERYEVYVLKSKGYESITDLNNTNFGIYDTQSESFPEAMKLLEKSVTFASKKTYEDFVLMMNDGIEGNISGFYISSSMTEVLKEDYAELFDQYEPLADYTVKREENIAKSDVDVTKEPFLVYISGIDTYGSIGTVSRSDVNILVAVNPKTQKILFVNTPRDYYVKLHSKKAMDKLTHAGIYGVEESMNTLGDLYETDIDFYFKVNFSSLVKVVDTLGGITVDSKYAFSYDGHSFVRGKNNLNGAAALAFSRSRKELPLGDISRGENQEAVLRALIEKATSPAIISKYISILDTLSKSFVTNMSEKDIYALAKMQINDNPKWTIEVQNASGHDASRTTYSAGKALLYVMEQDEASVNDVKQKLNDILEEN